MKYELDKYQRQIVDLIIKEYPFILDYDFKIQWDSSLNDTEPKSKGQFIVYTDGKIEIKLNPFRNYIEVVSDTLFHEFCHFIQHHKGEKLNHNKKFWRRKKKLFNKWIKSNKSIDNQ